MCGELWEFEWFGALPESPTERIKMTTGYNGTLSSPGLHKPFDITYIRRFNVKIKFPKIKYPKLRCKECGRFIAFLDATMLFKGFLCKKCSKGTK